MTTMTTLPPIPNLPTVPTPARRANFRQKRLAAAVQEVLAPVLLDAGQLHDDLQGRSMVITGVEVSPNLHDAKIFLQNSLLTTSLTTTPTTISTTISTSGQAAQDRVPLKLLKSLIPVIRSHLAGHLKLRYVPQLHFIEDQHWEQVTRIEALIERLPKPTDNPDPDL
ncbi:MAG: hypothetical protein FJX22_01085 [Alphaproteobacteria bacterium]|nr:hypothetical protein [Alphaproteobacteria bacterium]